MTTAIHLERSRSNSSSRHNPISVDSSSNCMAHNATIAEISPNERYIRCSQLLASSSNKQVYQAYDTHEGIEVAWNIVSLLDIPTSDQARIVNEVRLLQRLDHPNVIGSHGSWVHEEKLQVHYITEILTSGTLQSFRKKIQVIRWKIAKRWAKQILQGLQYLHSQGLSHPDLKCSTIFVNGTSGDLRIGDIGFRTSRPHPDQTPCQIYDDEENRSSSYEDTTSRDIYAFGMCMLEILTNETPYYSSEGTTSQNPKTTTTGPFPPSLYRIQNPKAIEFITLCLGSTNSRNVILRPDASQLLLHPFLAMGSDDNDDVVVVHHNPPQSPLVVGTVPTHAYGLPNEQNEGDQQQQHKKSTQQQSFENMQEIIPKMHTIKKKKKYVLAAGVIENNEGRKRNHLLRLVLTVALQEKGRVQNVQFDFHLMEDDPVQVAKEMVFEFHIPSEAVCPISETIRDLARSARRKLEANHPRKAAGTTTTRDDDFIILPNTAFQQQQQQPLLEQKIQCLSQQRQLEQQQIQEQLQMKQQQPIPPYLYCQGNYSDAKLQQQNDFIHLKTYPQTRGLQTKTTTPIPYNVQEQQQKQQIVQ